MMKSVQFKILDKRIGTQFPMPHYATTGSAGMDLRACIDAPLILSGGEHVLIETGIAVYIADENLTAMVLPRSGLGHKQGIVLGNLLGLIDADYQGPLMLSLWNRSSKDFCIEPGARVAQMVFVPVVKVKLDSVAEFKQTTRGAGGFGSSGVY